MTLDGDRTYEIRINDLVGSFNSVSADIHEFMFWSPDLFGMEWSLDAENNIGNDGAVIISEGYRVAQDIQLIGRHNTLIQNANEPFPQGHLQNIYRVFEAFDRYRAQNIYLDIELRSANSASSSTRRLWVKPKRTKYVPVHGSRYTDGEIRIDFFVADPFFYKGAITSGSANSNSGSAQSAIVNTYFPTQRATVYVYNTNGSAISGITGSGWASGESWVIAESLNGNGDYFEVDHFNGTVKKYVSGVASNVMDHFTGSFFDIAATIDIVRVQSTGAGTFRLETHVWEKAQYDVA
jgi:hypothetical protein